MLSHFFKIKFNLEKVSMRYGRGLPRNRASNSSTSETEESPGLRQKQSLEISLNLLLELHCGFEKTDMLLLSSSQNGLSPGTFARVDA